VLVNGKEVAGGGAAVVLLHNDRLCLGTYYCLVVVHLAQAAAGGPWPEVDWDSLNLNREVAHKQVRVSSPLRAGAWSLCLCPHQCPFFMCFAHKMCFAQHLETRCWWRALIRVNNLASPWSTGT
jgi:hypothetical protein